MALTFPKKWWVEPDFKAPNLPFPLRLKGSGCHYNIYWDKLGIIVVSAVVYEKKYGYSRKAPCALHLISTFFHCI